MTPPPDQPKDEDFLSRWSARKRAEAAPAPPSPAPVAEPAPDPRPEQPEADPEFLASLPRIEDIGPGTDIRAFLQAGVPRALKNAALRKAWAANPVIANYEDPARDYFWDYNTPGAVSGFGGKIGAADVARMADRVASGIADPPPEAPAPDAMAEEPGDSSEQVAAAPAPAAVQDPQPAPAGDAAPATGQRRHGGAMPA